jgi:hypothetical protein
MMIAFGDKNGHGHRDSLPVNAELRHGWNILLHKVLRKPISFPQTIVDSPFHAPAYHHFLHNKIYMTQ